ncbi:MAG: RdgB/HAM1 family non-canonical purine NTP pyrophosphatase [Bacteroidales bacterium]|nr:RdgB/HAM1 family non-canonical purine NTP pyrophosphatase [Bacteroidales bacterium]
MKTKLIFATGNPGKLREAEEILGEGFELVTPAEAGITEEIPENGNTIRANSQQKADYIYKKTGLNCFADDTGLEVEILGNAPGVETARYAGPEKKPANNIRKLLKEMDYRHSEASVMRDLGLDTPHDTRNARFRTSVTLILNGEHYYFDGVMEGSIGSQPYGKGGFGYDPVFIPEGYDVTAAQLSEEEKNAISHRGKALRAMAEFLHGDH